jgi:hypothetical protein
MVSSPVSGADVTAFEARSPIKEANAPRYFIVAPYIVIQKVDQLFGNMR